MDIRKQTQNVANQGRYGDSMLIHVNPAEVQQLAGEEIQCVDVSMSEMAYDVGVHRGERQPSY